MSRTVLAAATVALLISPALAEVVPAGWSRQPDGSFAHDASGVHCTSDVAGYAFKRLDGPSDPNVEGVCLYEQGGGESGLLRIRRYQQGVGETPMAIRNDEGLMHPDDSKGHVVSAFRGGPGPVVDGVQTYQVVFTTLAKGFLVDCIARHADKAMPPSEFPLACMKLGGG